MGSTVRGVGVWCVVFGGEWGRTPEGRFAAAETRRDPHDHAVMKQAELNPAKAPGNSWADVLFLESSMPPHLTWLEASVEGERPAGRGA
jgi:hypothetical protein